MTQRQRGRKTRVGFVLMTVLGLHSVLLAWSAMIHSPVVSEVNHLPAGLSHLFFGRFDLFHVNPPLIRCVAAAPVVLMSPETDWGRYDPSSDVRCDFAVGQDFLTANGGRSVLFFVVARWACIPFSAVGGYICFRWSRELHGSIAGYSALVLWCSCPFILGHGPLMTTDVPSAAMAIAACYSFWRWLNRPGFTEWCLASCLLGLAELTKFTLIVLYPLWTLMWLVSPSCDGAASNWKQWRSIGGALLGMFFVSIVIINVGYEYEGTFRPIGEYKFRSHLLSGGTPEPDDSNRTGNRFADACWRWFPVPLPANYLQGIDSQRLDFERKRWSYLNGDWRYGGWCFYYLYALAIKLPLGTWCLIAISSVCCLQRQYRLSGRNEIALLLPIGAVLALVSSQTGFSIHSRYVMPILPFLYIWCSRLARSIVARHRTVAIATISALCWSVSSSLWSCPHSLSYFNEIAGGPMHGHAHLLDSNIAWGQDICLLKRWYDDHHDARPLNLAYYGLMDPGLAGIEFTLPPLGPLPNSPTTCTRTEKLGPLPGWYAIDVNYLRGAKSRTRDGQGGWQSVATDASDLTYFQRFQPVATAGYSIYIYHITIDEANRVRRELGLETLSNSGQASTKAVHSTGN
jgi:hypothetical protein